MFEKIFGKKKSIQRSLVRSFIISIALVIIITIIEFSIFVLPSINTQLIDISKENVNSLIYVVRRFLGITIVNIILISVVLIRINTKKMLQPMKQINEATKKVTAGDYDIELATKREDEIGELTQIFNNMTKGFQSIENLSFDKAYHLGYEVFLHAFNNLFLRFFKNLLTFLCLQ